MPQRPNQVTRHQILEILAAFAKEAGAEVELIKILRENQRGIFVRWDSAEQYHQALPNILGEIASNTTDYEEAVDAILIFTMNNTTTNRSGSRFETFFKDGA